MTTLFIRDFNNIDLTKNLSAVSLFAIIFQPELTAKSLAITNLLKTGKKSGCLNFLSDNI